MTTSTFTWKQISPDQAAAKTRRILEIIARAEQRIRLQNVDPVELEEVKLKRKALKATTPQGTVK